MNDLMTINLVDHAFAHLHVDSGRYSSVHGKISKHIKYVRNQQEFDGVTIFTDGCMHPGILAQVKSTHKIAWLIENRQVNPLSYDMFNDFVDSVDFVLTHDEQLLQQNRYNLKEKCIELRDKDIKLKEYEDIIQRLTNSHQMFHK